MAATAAVFAEDDDEDEVLDTGETSEDGGVKIPPVDEADTRRISKRRPLRYSSRTNVEARL